MASSQINYMRIDHNAWQDNSKGMIIHVGFNVQDLMGQLGQVAAYFNYWQGGPLKDFDSAYRTQDGHVAAHINFIPPSVSTTENVQIFMPHSQLDMVPGPGRVALMCQVAIWDISLQVPQELARSPWNQFWYNSDTPSPDTNYKNPDTNYQGGYGYREPGLWPARVNNEVTNIETEYREW
jgi:hypothetical protein